MKSDFTESELLFELADLTNKATFDSDFIKNQVKSLLLILGDKFILNEQEYKEFEEIIMRESSHLASIVERTTVEMREEAKKQGELLGIGEGVRLGREEGLKEGRKEGMEEGDEKRAISVAKWMLEKEMSIEDIQEATGLSINKINSIKKE